MMIGNVFWIRGFFSSTKERLRMAKERLTTKTTIALVGLLVAFIAVAGYAHYNLSVLNTILDGHSSEKVNADAEKKYAKYIGSAHPQITELKAYIDILRAASH